MSPVSLTDERIEQIYKMLKELLACMRTSSGADSDSKKKLEAVEAEVEAWEKSK